jgi:osmoprotectant transport system ATP-binding protein
VSDTVTRDATLRDALEAVLTDNTGRVAVTGRRGEYTGVVDMETLMNSVHELLEADRLEALEAQHELEEARAAQTHAEQEGPGGEVKACPSPSWRRLPSRLPSGRRPRPRRRPVFRGGASRGRS